MKRPAKRTFEFTYRDVNGGTYFYVTLADEKQRARVKRKVGLKRNELLVSIRHFWIGKKLRGKGYGKRLIKQLTGALDAIGHAAVLYALPYDGNKLGREGLVKFYEAAGFKTIGVAKGDEWDGCPIMVRGIV